jgi:hypothetical protein
LSLIRNICFIFQRLGKILSEFIDSFRPAAQMFTVSGNIEEFNF